MKRRWLKVYVRSRRALLTTLGILIGLVILAETFFEFRERANRQEVYQPVGPGDEDYRRARRDIRLRIALLQRPRHGEANIGGDPSARLIEAGLLYGRLALLEETRGNTAARDRHMADGIALLRAARHPSPTEEHIREAVAKQDANRRAER
jgi:hypothetical protein